MLFRLHWIFLICIGIKYKGGMKWTARTDLKRHSNMQQQSIKDSTAKAVKLLTKQKGYVMADYIHGIKANPMAAAVKAADRLHNLQSAVIADEAFKRKYILESINWYLDFSPEIPVAVKKLADTLKSPPRKLLEAIAGKPGFSYVKNEHETVDLRTSAFILKGDICYSISLNEMITMEGAYGRLRHCKPCGQGKHGQRGP